MTKHKLFDTISQTIIMCWVVAMVTMVKVVTMVIMVKMKIEMCHFPHYNININKIYIYIIVAVLTTRKMILTILTILTTWGVSNCLSHKNAQTFVDRNGHVVTLHCAREKRPLSPLPRGGGPS